MTKKYSSFKEHQLITENWRKFLREETEEEGLPPEVLKALDILSDGPMEEGQDPLPLPISRDDFRASLPPRSAEAWDERSPANQAVITALANAIHGTVHGALLLKKGGALAREKVAEYLEQNPDKVAAIKTILDAIERGGEKASRILWKVGALVAAGALVALPAFIIYDAGRAIVDDTYESVLVDDSESSSTYDPYVDYSSGQSVPRE